MEYEKKALKKQVNRVALGILLYNVILMAVVFVDAVRQSVWVILEYGDGPGLEQRLNQLVEEIGRRGGSSIIGVLIGLLFLALYFRRETREGGMFCGNRSMAPGKFGRILVVFLSCQFVFSLLSTAVEQGLNRLGYSMMGEILAASGGSTTVSMFLYVAFIGPVAEELVYRGFVLRGLERYGKVFAIVVSSALFAVMHMNLIQGTFAFFIGLVLAYVALEYSIYWSVLLHVFNNLVMAQLWSRAVAGLPDMAQAVLEWGVMAVLFAGGCLILWRNRQAVAGYRREYGADGKMYRCAFTSVWMVVFLVICVGAGLAGIERIG